MTTKFNSYQSKTILVTGHTGFKGAWLSLWLHELGAKVVGYSLEKYPNEAVFRKTNLSKKIIDERGDIRDLKKLKSVFTKYKPDLVFHLAAQPLVRDSYDYPQETMETNIMGTVNVLECIRLSPNEIAGVMITTDKCYKNKEHDRGYKETDELGGRDPYSASKACAELVIDCYRHSFPTTTLIASVRAGNVIGGGDYSKDRLIPDCIIALENSKPVPIRNPEATRPWQHVLEPLSGYLLVGEHLLQKKKEFAEPWNFGPEKKSVVPVKEVVEQVIKVWGNGSSLDMGNDNDKHEAGKLCLNIDKAKARLHWKPQWDINLSIRKTVEWYKLSSTKDPYQLCVDQINEYQKKLSF